MKLRKIMAASIVSATVLIPASTAWAGGTSGGGSGSLVTVGDVSAANNPCTNVNINLGVEIHKTQTCN